jgi:hypothetical protein
VTGSQFKFTRLSSIIFLRLKKKKKRLIKSCPYRCFCFSSTHVQTDTGYVSEIVYFGWDPNDVTGLLLLSPPPLPPAGGYVDFPFRTGYKISSYR